MDSASHCSTHQASTGPHISVAVSCGLGLGNTRRAAAVHGAGKSASTAGMCMAARKRVLNACICAMHGSLRIVDGCGLRHIANARDICGLDLADERLGSWPRIFQKLGALALDLLGSLRAHGARMVGDIGEVPHQAGIEERAQRIVHGLQLEIDEFLVERGERRAR